MRPTSIAASWFRLSSERERLPHSSACASSPADSSSCAILQEAKLEPGSEEVSSTAQRSASSMSPCSWATAERARNSRFDGMMRGAEESAREEPARTASRTRDSIPGPTRGVRDTSGDRLTSAVSDRKKEWRKARTDLPPPVETTRGLYQAQDSDCK